MHASPGNAPPEGPIRRFDWTGPFVLAATCFFSFGLLLSRLGYFQDDWHHVFYAATQGTHGLRSFLLTDRGPFAWLVYAPLFKILGYSPSVWHWAMMLVRLLTVLVFWLSVRRVWPRRESLTIWLGLLFAIYPIFTLQPLAVAYALHWAMYLVFMISILLMLEAAQSSRRFLLLTGFALILEAAHLLMIEYFSGLELARPILLWLLLSDLAPRERIRRSLGLALPYLGVLLLYAVYRASFGLIFGFDRFNTLATLGALAQSPLTTLPGILQAIVQDVIHVLFSQWYAAMDPAIIDFSRPSMFLILGSGAVWAAATFLLLSRSDRTRSVPDMESHPGQVTIAGASLLILSMLPFWLTGFSIYQKNQLWSERLALGAMPGASMLILGAVFALMDRPASRNLVLSILIGLGVAMHARTARDFQASWDKQLQLYWQLHWRAPSLRPNTLLVSDQEILFFMGIYPTAFSINVLYPQVTQPPEASYWFNAGFEHMDYDAFAGGAPKAFEKYGTTFSATAEHVLAITFEPGQDQCLWVLRPGLANARTLTSPARAWLEVSDEARIEAAPGSIPRRDVFGPEPGRTWCTYFEKADLARQQAHWKDVLQLWREASELHVRAGNGVELLPFIEAFAQEGSWAEARALTVQAQVLPDRSTAALCDLWGVLAAQASASEAGRDALDQVQQTLRCSP